MVLVALSFKPKKGIAALIILLHFVFAFGCIKKMYPKWVALVSGNTGQNLRSAGLKFDPRPYLLLGPEETLSFQLPANTKTCI